MLLDNPVAKGCTVYFVRHGETEWNAQERMVGLVDIPLNDKGLKQAASAGACLGWLDRQAAGLDFITGPLLRTRQTMEIVPTTLGLKADGYLQDEPLSANEY